MLVIFATPFFKTDTNYFIEALLGLPDIRLAIISQEPEEVLPQEIRSRLAAHWRVSDSLSSDQLTWAAEELSRRLGPVHRILAINEQIQVPVAFVRSRLNVEGMMPDTILNFRDKSRMKDRFRANGIPCARHCQAVRPEDAWEFVSRVGFPVCIKPVDGAAAQATYRVETREALEEVLKASGPSWGRPIQIEEFVTGKEHSFETVSLNGKRVWHSLTRYIPTPLDVMNNPWIQWRVILPREIDSKEFDDIRKVSLKALNALGMETGLSHMEWFRRADGTLAISEVGGRPPGAQIVTMMNRAHDFDIFREWANLMVLGRFNAPKERRYACGAAFLRGLGGGRVKAVHGLDYMLRQLGDMVTDAKIPQVGQAAGTTYEGEGYVLVRHPETARVEEALEEIVSNVRVELV